MQGDGAVEIGLGRAHGDGDGDRLDDLSGIVSEIEEGDLASDPAVGEKFLADPYATTVPMQRLFSPGDQLRVLGRPARDRARLASMKASESPAPSQ